MKKEIIPAYSRLLDALHAHSCVSYCQVRGRMIHLIGISVGHVCRKVNMFFHIFKVILLPASLNNGPQNDEASITVLPLLAWFKCQRLIDSQKEEVLYSSQ